MMRKKGKLLLMLGLLAVCIAGYVCLRSIDWKEETDNRFNVQSISEAIEEAEQETETGTEAETETNVE